MNLTESFVMVFASSLCYEANTTPNPSATLQERLNLGSLNFGSNLHSSQGRKQQDTEFFED
jgi:hypothetical protein